MCVRCLCVCVCVCVCVFGLTPLSAASFTAEETAEGAAARLYMCTMSIDIPDLSGLRKLQFACATAVFVNPIY